MDVEIEELIERLETYAYGPAQFSLAQQARDLAEALRQEGQLDES